MLGELGFEDARARVAAEIFQPKFTLKTRLPIEAVAVNLLEQ